jgi:hypothetical protein
MNIKKKKKMNSNKDLRKKINGGRRWRRRDSYFLINYELEF